MQQALEQAVLAEEIPRAPFSCKFWLDGRSEGEELTARAQEERTEDSASTASHGSFSAVACTDASTSKKWLHQEEGVCASPKSARSGSARKGSWKSTQTGSSGASSPSSKRKSITERIGETIARMT